ncbi:MAG: cyclase family protein, partial [Gammaproteobacteria bacterium]
MKKLIFIFLFIQIFASLSASEPFVNGKWIDLTHEFSEDSIYWPTAETFNRTTVFSGYTDAGFYYSAYNFSAAEHGGTHIDAPIHFYENRNTVDQIPIDQLIGAGIVIRIADKANKNRNYQFSVGDILEWENKHGYLPENS